MLNSNHHEYDIEEIAHSTFLNTAMALNFLSHHAVFLTKNDNESRRILGVSHTSPDPKDGRQWTIIRSVSIVRAISSFDEETGMPIYTSRIVCDDDLTSLSDTFDGAIIKFATKVMLRYGG